jgi:hypothetical protein
MGTITMGVPTQAVRGLSSLNNATVFVETGTFRGDTTRWASAHFKTVHTIERSEPLYRRFGEPLSNLGNIMPHFGDSRTILPRILEDIGDSRAMYWLDGHWSGGVTAGETDECPLAGELACLRERSQDIILIDDSRLFLAAPPPPHNPAHWPTIAEIVQLLDAPDKRYVQVIDDVIFAVPNTAELRSLLIRQAQQKHLRSA